MDSFELNITRENELFYNFAPGSFNWTIFVAQLMSLGMKKLNFLSLMIKYNFILSDSEHMVHRK